MTKYATQKVLNTAQIVYDTMWDPVMKAFPKVDESESGQMVLK